ncbi:MAG TPA: type IX secretion system sortase PorU [Edaphocola sp.]|nr:type IX secretion system sortase PorU [Edaphocola sp.]
MSTNIKTLLITALLCFAASFTWSQKIVQYKDLHAFKIDEQGFYTDRMLFDVTLDSIRLQLLNLEYEPVSADIPEGVHIAQHHVQLEQFFGKERKKLVAGFRLPIYFNRNDSLYRVTGFSISYEEPAPARLVKRTYAANSVLSSGTWYKIGVAQRGVVRIDYNLLQSLGINPANVNPQHIRVYGNGGTVMPEAVTDDVPDDLVENAVSVHASGSSFGTNDYVLFYANGPVLWQYQPARGIFEHTPNYYEDKSYYFITFDLGPGKRIQESSPVSGAVAETITAFDAYYLIDQDSLNLGEVGKMWFGHNVPRNSSIDIPVHLGAFQGEVRLDYQAGAIVDAGSMSFNIKQAGNNLLSDVFGVSDGYTTYYSQRSGTAFFTPGSANFNVTFSNTAASINARMYVDYLRFNYKRPLSVAGIDQLDFRSLQQRLVGSSDLVNFAIANAGANVKVWDVTNPIEPESIPLAFSGNNASFLAAGGLVHEYILFNGNSFVQPSAEGAVANQNLHALAPVEYLIITNNQLLPAAERLAQIHRDRFNRSVQVVTVDKIYNEFSSGGQDIAGIRNFIRMFYDRGSGSNELKNVLLMGAASYDYKDRIDGNTNLVPVYQTLASYHSSMSYSTDEFYALMDPGESVAASSNAGNYIDLGVGRIPARNIQEANDYVDKVERYLSAESFGEWKSSVTFVSDDYSLEDRGGYDFLGSIEQMSTALDNANNQFVHAKLYSDASPRVATAGGIKFPNVTREINNQVFNGTMLLNYVGHGSPQRWAVEELLFKGDVDRWSNMYKMPLVITATCDFGRFDNPNVHAVGTQMVTKRNGGAIASLTTTQVVSEWSNNQLNAAYLHYQFKQQNDGSYLSFGEAFMHAKNAINTGAGIQENSKRFVILGDPALSPSIPVNKLVVEEILEQQGDENLVPSDTLKALGRYVVKGRVTQANGIPMTDFNGLVYLSVYDKIKIQMATNQLLLDAPAHKQKDFKVQNSVLFRGSTTATNGEFEISIILPKDINFDFGSGKMVLYAHDDSREAMGVDTNFIVGGYSPFAGSDNDAPIVQPYIDNNKFRDGDIVSPDPMLYVELSDNNGINVSGSSIGHDLIAVLDGDYANPFILNAFYRTAPNDYTQGNLYYQLSKLSPGKHTITVRAWDIYNNSGEGSISFFVKDSDTVDFNLYNYPNPFSSTTNIVLQHNQPNVEMEVVLKIFTSSGALVYEEQQHIRPSASFTEWVWDGRSNTGAYVGNGLYFYQISIKTSEGKSKTLYNKLSFFR